jgi:DUF3108-like
MKKLILLIVVMVYGSNLSFAQCNKIFDFQEGTSWQWTNYDKKGKFNGKTMHKVEKYTALDDGFEITLSAVVSDKKGEQFSLGSMAMSCKNDIFYIDMKKFIPTEMFESKNGEMSIEATGENLDLPINMKPGDYLRDAYVTMNLGGTDLPMDVRMTVEIFERKVDGEEKLNTPAGEFNTLIISQSVKVKTIISSQFDSKEWYAPGVGMVKSESYKKGKLMGYSILTQFSK